MKRLITIGLVCLQIFLFQQANFADTWNRVKWVIDGDTVVLDKGRKVRYIGINAPELGHDEQKAEPFARKAKVFNASLVDQREVRLEFDKERIDSYQRQLAYVYLRNGTFVNAEMLLSGYAYLLYRQPNIRYDSTLLQAQRAAMTAKNGIWQHWRETKRIYVGNKRSRRFHLPTCPFGRRINPQNRIVFQKQRDAYWEGYAPAKRCIPTFDLPE